MITIRNASGAVLTHFDNNVPEGNPYFEPKMTENMESLVSSFSFSVPLQLEDTDYLVGLNQVLAKDKDEDLRMFVITDVYEDWNTTNGTIRVEAEDISITEMNSIIVPPINVNSFEAALKAIFNKTGWSYELTANPSTTDRALFVLDGYTNMRDALVKLRDVYGCQYKFMAQEDAYGKVTRVVKVFKNRGNNTGKYFYYDRDLTNIERDISHTNIKTAAYITYKDAAGKVHNLLNWLPNHPINGYTKDYSSALVVNNAAHIHWDDPEVYRVYLHESDLQDPYQAFQEGVEALGKLSEPMYTYKMNVILLQNLIGWEGEDIHLGDTIWAKERVGDRELGLEAQVVEYIYHEDDPTQDSVTFSNYKEIDTTDAKDLSNRIYFAYANSADGTLDFSTTDSANKLYMGVYTSDAGTQTTDPSVYNWTRIKGEDGAVAPTLQLNATSQIMKFKANNTVDGAQTITFEAVVQYMAQDSVVWKAVPFIGNTAQANITLTGTGLSRTLTSAQWNKDWTRVSVTVSANGLSDVVSVIKVSDGASGASGESSITGFLSNEAVTFAANSVGTVSDYSTGKGTFIIYDGLKPVTNRVVYTLQSSTGITVVINPTTGDYVPDKMTTNMAQAVFTASYKGVVITKSVTFSKSIAGANGANGTNGKDGTNGTDGNTTYIAYANSADGKTGFSTTDSVNKSYVGMYTGKPSGGQPVDPTKYKWSLFKGSSATNFSLTSDSTIMKFDASGNIKAGQVITFNAIRQVITEPISWTAIPYVDTTAQPQIILGGTSETTKTLVGSQWGYGVTSIKVKAECGEYEDTTTIMRLQDGAKGENGTAAYTHLAYANSADGKTDFSLTYPTTNPPKYLGVYVGNAETAPTDPTKYVWMVFKGADGSDGTDGVGITSTEVTYQASASGTTVPSGTWSATIPTVSANQYLWTRTSITYSNGSVVHSYSVGKMGANGTNGKDGVDGKTQYTHIAYSNSADGKTDFSTTDSNREYIGMYVDFKEADSSIYTDYNWTLVKGADGTQGTPGKAGADGKTPYFHTAWSYSADGTDGFTTTYPNLNLLINSSAKTKDGFFKNFDKVENGYGEVTIKGTNTWVSRNISDGFSIQPRDYKPNDTYTMSMDIMFTSWNLPAGTTLTEFWLGQRYSASSDGKIASWKKISFINLPRDPSQMLNQWIRITQTSRIPSYADPSVNTAALFITKFTGPSEGSYTIRIRKPKQEQGLLATSWMPSASEVTTADWPSYIGQYTDFTQADSTDPTKYKWSLIKGSDGKDGADGSNGIGISKTDITYQASTSGTTVPTGAWSESIPTVAANQYLWTRTVLTYTNGTTSTGYSIGKMGANGTNGKDGNDGLSSYVHVAYASSSDGVTDFTTVYPNPSKPDFIPSYLGTLVNHTEAASTKPSDYTWVKSRGDAGENGIVGILTNEAQQLAANSGGSISDYTPAKGTFQIFEGTTLVTKGVTYSMTDADGGTATINASSGAYAVTFVAKDVTNFVFKAVYKGLTILKTFCISKSKQGVQGVQGVQGLMGIAFYSPTAPVGQGVKEGATWFKTVSATDDTILSINKFKNGNWIETSLASGALNVESLSALSANLGDVTTGSLTGVTITSSKFISPFDTQTSETVPRRIKGTSTWQNGQMYNTFNFLDSSGTDVGRGYFISGNDRLFYRELDYSVAAGRITNDWVLNQEGFSSKHYRPDDGTGLYSVDREISVNSSGIVTRGGVVSGSNIAPSSYLNLSSTTFSKYGIFYGKDSSTGASTGTKGATETSLSNPFGGLDVRTFTAKPDVEIPSIASGDGLFSAADSTINKLMYGSDLQMGFGDGFKGRYFTTDSKVESTVGDKVDTKWALNPAMLQNIQFVTSSQIYGNGETAPVSSWTNISSNGTQISFPSPRQATSGPWASGNSSYPFGTTSDFKTITYNGFEYNTYNEHKIWWKIDIVGRSQIQTRNANYYTYVNFKVNGDNKAVARSVWGSVAWAQTWAISTSVELKVGDKLTCVVESNTDGKSNYMGGITQLVMTPYMRREYKTYDGSNVAS